MKGAKKKVNTREHITITIKYLLLSLVGHDAAVDEDNGYNDAPVSW